MPFRSMTIYLSGESELKGTHIRFEQITLPPGAMWGGMKFRENQAVCLEPPHPVHGVLLMKEQSKAVFTVTICYDGDEQRARLCIGAEGMTSLTELVAGPVEITANYQNEHCVWFSFKKKDKVVSLPSQPMEKSFLSRKAMHQ